MSRTTIAVYRPTTAGGEDRVLAEGMRTAWAAALLASGANVIVPFPAGDVDCDPLGGGQSYDELLDDLAHGRGRLLTHDKQPIADEPYAVVRTRFVRGPGSLRLIVAVVGGSRPPVLRGGRTFRGATAELRAMATTLHTIARATGVRIPAEIGWRELTFSNKSAEGRAHLLEAGAESLPEALCEAVPTVH